MHCWLELEQNGTILMKICTQICVERRNVSKCKRRMWDLNLFLMGIQWTAWYLRLLGPGIDLNHTYCSETIHQGLRV